MADNESTTSKIANPAGLGLLAFGMTTMLLSLYNLGLYESNSIVLVMGVFYGGIAQIVAGIFEFKKGNTFGATAFTSYGFFWLTFVVISLGFAGASEPAALGAYFAIWGILTLFLFIGTLKGSRALQAVFLGLTILFFVVAIKDALEIDSLAYVAGAVGIFTAASAMYTAFAEILNEQFGRTVLPLC